MGLMGACRLRHTLKCFQWILCCFLGTSREVVKPVSKQESVKFTAMVAEGNGAAVKTGTAKRGSSQCCTDLGLRLAAGSKGALLIKAH